MPAITEFYDPTADLKALSNLVYCAVHDTAEADVWHQISVISSQLRLPVGAELVRSTALALAKLNRHQHASQLVERFAALFEEPELSSLKKVLVPTSGRSKGHDLPRIQTGPWIPARSYLRLA